MGVMTQGSVEVEDEVFAMETETAVDYDAYGQSGRIEVGVDEGDDITTVYVENQDCDEDEGLTLMLDIDELDALIASLQRARATAAANRG